MKTHLGSHPPTVTLPFLVQGSSWGREGNKKVKSLHIEKGTRNCANALTRKISGESHPPLQKVATLIYGTMNLTTVYTLSVVSGLVSKSDQRDRGEKEPHRFWVPTGHHRTLTAKAPSLVKSVAVAGLRLGNAEK